MGVGSGFEGLGLGQKGRGRGSGFGGRWGVKGRQWVWGEGLEVRGSEIGDKGMLTSCGFQNEALYWIPVVTESYCFLGVGLRISSHSACPP